MFGGWCILLTSVRSKFSEFFRTHLLFAAVGVDLRWQKIKLLENYGLFEAFGEMSTLDDFRHVSELSDVLWGNKFLYIRY